jgi:hypothetical protein
MTLAALLLAGPIRAHDSTGHQHADPQGIAGTWIVLLQGHQIGLEVEQRDGTLTGSLYLSGQPVPVDGTIEGRAFSLAINAEHLEATGMAATTLTGTYKEDDTLDGEMTLHSGTWPVTAERMKKP